MSIPILLLRLEGPMQSWGERARWDFRDSSPLPTKSGVIGLIACAMGLTRGSSAIADLHRALKMAVRADRMGTLMTDYHTVSGVIQTASGGQRGNKGEVTTIVSERQYIQDGAFLVALSGELDVLQKCAEALNNPTWPVFLGRKSCPPARPVYERITQEYVSLFDALSHEPTTIRRDSNALLCEIEEASGTITRRDTATNRPGRTYLERAVRVDTVYTKEAL